MTGDNWSDIARDLFIQTGSGAAVAMYFVSFQLIVALVLVNVVIAVLLDEFSKAAERRDAGGDSSAEEDRGNKCPFDKIARYLSEYRDLDDLESMINDLYDRVLAKSKLRAKMGGGLSISEGSFVVGVCVCVCVCVCVYLYVCMHACMHVCIHSKQHT